MNEPNKPKTGNIHAADAWAMAFGCMVGWGVFAMPGTTFIPLAGPLGTLIALFVGMLIMLIIGNNFAFLMKRTPISGGIYSYTKEAFGRDHAFLSSWFLCLSYLTIVFLNGTALFVVIRTLFNDALQNGLSYTIAGNKIYIGETIISVLVLTGVGILFMSAKSFLYRLQTALSIILITGVFVTAVICVPNAVANGALSSFGTTGINKWYAVFSIVILSPWAFVGFEVISFDTPHFGFPVRNSGRIITVSIICAALAYISMTLISIGAVPDGFSSWQEYISALGDMGGIISVPTFYTARSIMGSTGIVIMTATGIASILTGIIGGYRATTRVLSIMAEDHILSEKFSKTSYSILFIMGISIILSFLGRNTLNWFVDLTSFGAIVGFGYTSAAAYKIARSENRRATKITGLTGTVISIIFVIVQIVPRLTALETIESEAFLLLSLWCLVGFVFYWRTVTRSTLTEYSGMSTSGVVLFALLTYSAIMWLAKLLMNKGTVDDIRTSLVYGGAFLILIIFIGLIIMLYIQNLVRKKHEAAELEKIRAVEGSLAKSRFLFNMSHDIRTPMNAIIGYTHLALKEHTSGQVHDYLEKIDRSGNHLLSLINDILEMSRIENGKMSLEFVPADFCAVFNDMHDLFSEQMKQKNITFTTDTAQVRNKYVMCDVKNFNRVLLNLIGNAYKFTPDGGNISVSVSEMPDTANGSGKYEVRIRDSGIGMSAEFASKMFNAFERERTPTISGVEGTGLGLSITKSIVDLMGGTIDVITAPGKGTEIVIRLTLSLADKADVLKDAEEQEAAAAAANIDFSGKRLLLVEDNLINQEIASTILKQAGFDVETAVNGKEAVGMVAASEPGYYNAVLMDVQMPVMDGYTATKKIRVLDNKDLASVPIIAMTANAFKEYEDEALEAGMQAHVAKPIDIPVLMRTLAKFIK